MSFLASGLTRTQVTYHSSKTSDADHQTPQAQANLTFGGSSNREEFTTFFAQCYPTPVLLAVSLSPYLHQLKMLKPV
ncbi:hypothetical protein IQ259_26360 [Fortiea sp. LEGE XX443]|uniref:hypothetical protein n=1 Tax=Fortiea sp. LEGE XX443 TaxID=1828611 RepID=UPI001880D1AD|nr:hypothetical protein [Fortiea sp. LEGE XX443]MBE9008473.1 hypothetical protein [Fortiea sp. LEGE XX443]